MGAAVRAVPVRTAGTRRLCRRHCPTPSMPSGKEGERERVNELEKGIQLWRTKYNRGQGKTRSERAQKQKRGGAEAVAGRLHSDTEASAGIIL